MTDLELEAQYFKDSLFQLGKDIGVRIESPNDMAFWDFIFKKALPNSRIEFYPQCFNYPSSSTMGKNCVMLLKELADKELVLCVDSDYDYLLENVDLQRPFIFQTHVYSLENYWSYAEGLKNMLEKTTHTEGVDFDFFSYFKNFSHVIYDWLICSLYSEKIKDEQLSRENCGKEIGINKIEILSIEDSLDILNAHLRKITVPLTTFYEKQDGFQNFKDKLSELGLTKDNAYLFIRGHDLFDRVTIPLVKAIGEKITKERFEALKIAKDTEGMKRYSNYLKHNTYSNYLKYHNKAFQNHFLFQKITDKIKTDFN